MRGLTGRRPLFTRGLWKERRNLRTRQAFRAQRVSQSRTLVQERGQQRMVMLPSIITALYSLQSLSRGPEGLRSFPIASGARITSVLIGPGGGGCSVA